MKIIVVFGTRPEAVKMCPLILELKKYSDVETIVCLTGQHKEMLEQVMNVFYIHEDYNLSIMKEKQTLSMITTGILNGIEAILDEEKPDIVLVHGDTTTSFATCLASFYHKIPVGHIEAGLRTYNLQSPFPEEFNRQVVDVISDLCFAPTDLAKQQLLKEGKSPDRVFVTGNTVIDALKTTVKKDYENEHLKWAKGSKLILVTAHRRENIGKPMEEMFMAIREIAEDYPEVKVIYPIHKNPVVREIALRIFSSCERIKIIEPVDVIDFHNFINQCYLVLTDSGGIQEEAPSLGKPVLVMRDTTERPEGVEAGVLKLVGCSKQRIYEETKRLLLDEAEYRRMSNTSNPYGNGHASEIIVKYLIEYLRKKEEILDRG